MDPTDIRIDLDPGQRPNVWIYPFAGVNRLSPCERKRGFTRWRFPSVRFFICSFVRISPVKFVKPFATWQQQTARSSLSYRLSYRLWCICFNKFGKKNPSITVWQLIENIAKMPFLVTLKVILDPSPDSGQHQNLITSRESPLAMPTKFGRHL